MNDYQVLLVVVGRGQAEDVIAVAHAAGATGGTIVPCRGSGHHDLHEVLYMPLDTEREMIVLLTPAALTRQIALAVNERFSLDQPGQGLLLTMETDLVRGAEY